MIKPGLWHLTVSLKSIDSCIKKLALYQITKSNEDLSWYLVESTFGINLAHIVEERSIKNIGSADRLCDFHDLISKINTKDSFTDHNIKRITLILKILKREILQLLREEVKYYGNRINSKTLPDILSAREEDPLGVLPYFISLLQVKSPECF